MCTPILCGVSSDGAKKAGPHKRAPPSVRCLFLNDLFGRLAQAALKGGQLGVKDHLQPGHGVDHGLHRLVGGQQHVGGDVLQGDHLLDLLTLGVEDVGQSGLLQGHGLDDVGDGLGTGGVAGGDNGHSHNSVCSFKCIERLLAVCYARRADWVTKRAPRNAGRSLK